MRFRNIPGSVIALALCLCAVDGARAQSLDWVRQAGGTIGTGVLSVETAYAIAVDGSSNSHITGVFRTEATLGIGEPNQTVLRGVSSQDIFVAKYDANGRLVWARSAGGNGIHQNWAFGIAVDAAGNSYVTGWFSYLTTFVDFGNGVTLNSAGAFVVKYDSDGTPVWARTLHSSGSAVAIAVDPNGNSVVTGSAPEPVQLLPQITLWKLGADGSLMWTQSAVGVYSGGGYGISIDSNGHTAVTGVFEGGTAVFGAGGPTETNLTSAVSGGGMFVARYDATGNLRWARQSADLAGSWARATALSTDAGGNSYLVGIGSPVLGHGEPNETAVTSMFVAKYDASGSLAWARSVSPGFGTVSWLFAIATSSTGQTYLTGTSIQGNVFIEKYTTAGNLLWSRRLAAITSTDALALAGYGIAVDDDGHAYVAGEFSSSVVFGPGEPNETHLTTTSGNFDFDLFLAKYLGDGPAENTPPVAHDQGVTTPEDVPIAIVLSASDANGDPLAYSIVAGPAHGVLSGTPSAVTYTPHLNYHGPDQFTFRAFDGVAFSNTATVSIGVTPVNDAPIAHAQAVITAQDLPVPVTLTGQDVDGDALVFSIVTPPSHGTLSGTAPNLTYTPASGYVGSDSFTFVAFDGTATSVPATVSLTIGVTILGCGSLTSGNIAAAAEIDRYAFVGQAGQIIALAMASTGGFSTNPSLGTSVELMAFAPSGALVAHVRSNSQGNFTLPQTGTYTIRVSASNLTTIGSYNLNLECLFPPSPDAARLPCGTLNSGRITALAQVDLFTVSGQAGQIISLALASTGGFSTNPSLGTSVELMLFAASGALVAHVRSNSQGIYTLPQTGLYVIRVNASNLATTGSYNVNLECHGPASPDAVVVPCGALSSGRIHAPGQVDLFTIAGDAGQIVSLALASTGGFSTNPSLGTSVELMLFAPTGVLVAHVRSNSQGNYTLPQTGTYVVRVNASNLATTGSYNLNFECLFPASPDAARLPCGTLSSGRITAPAQVDVFTLSGQAGQIISLALASTGGFSTNPSLGTSVELMLFASSGALVAHLRSNSQSNFTLPIAGTYIVRVSASNLATTGSYNVNLECIAPASSDALTIGCGTLSPGRIHAPGQVDLFTYAGQAGQVVSLALTSTGGFSTNPSLGTSAELMLFAPSGTLVAHLRSNSQGNFTLPQTGTHVARVSATNLATIGSYSVSLGCSLAPRTRRSDPAFALRASARAAPPPVSVQ